MKPFNYKIPEVFFVMILISVFFSGCVQPINLGLIEIGKNSTSKEFYIDNYQVKLRVIPRADNYQYICSMSLIDKNNSISIKNVKSNMDIKIYSSHSEPRRGIQQVKQMIITGIEPIKDTLSNDFNYIYKLSNKGKYELIIKLSEFDGKKLEKEILISFDQEVR